MNFNVVKEAFNRFNAKDTIKIYYGEYLYIFNLNDVSYDFYYGSLIIHNLIDNKELIINIASINAIIRINSKFEGLNNISKYVEGENEIEV